MKLFDQNLLNYNISKTQYNWDSFSVYVLLYEPTINYKILKLKSVLDEGEKRIGQLDIMAQQLKFVACLKILMEELSTLATGFEVDGGQLRYQLYVWLEREVDALRQLCSYSSSGDGDVTNVIDCNFLFITIKSYEIIINKNKQTSFITTNYFCSTFRRWYHGRWRTLSQTRRTTNPAWNPSRWKVWFRSQSSESCEKKEMVKR